MTDNREADTQAFLHHAIVILAGIGFDFFSRPAAQALTVGTQVVLDEVLPVDKLADAQSKATDTAMTLVKAIQEKVSTASYPDVEWYWTSVDCRARVLSKDGSDASRVFLRLELAAKWLRVTCLRTSAPQFKMSTAADLEEHLPEIEVAYKTAVKYLEDKE